MVSWHSTSPKEMALKDGDKIDLFVRSNEGGTAIRRVLLANNGIAAVKEMRSVRKWAYETFGDDRVIEFVAMATPEDFKANAEYIKMADRVLDVPGGTNNNNYANVDLIVELAQQAGVEAVWAGWGHASENPRLPEKLSRCQPPIAFIGPRPASMRALGDKISSTIVAQSLGIPVIPWSGSGIVMDPKDCFDEATCAPIYQRAFIETMEMAVERARDIGFPLMIKASEGGGGKGIRKVLCMADIKLAFEQVQREVPGSPIFLMRLSQHSRHLEIQVVADQHGGVLTLFGRDCSVQRRHQKILEEAPISVVEEAVSLQMEEDAIRLARSVNYESVGTVEFLYDLSERQHYFLELNPRLQVEHPTTEMVSHVNIPSVQLQVAMGIPLHRIAEIRRLYGQDVCGVEPFSFAPVLRKQPHGHVIAARITAENPDAGFKPNGGRLHELSFKGAPDTWGYFSVGSAGGLHEYADSQFGHVFAHGETREAARRSMVLALKNLTIRSEFRTTVEYLVELLEREDYRENRFDTAWLDGLIAKKGPSKRLSRELAIVCGCAVIATCKFAAHDEEVMTSVRNRGIPNPTLLANDLNLQFIHDNVSYSCTVLRSSPTHLSLTFKTKSGQMESLRIRSAQLPDGGYLMTINGRNHMTYVKKEGQDFRVTIDGKTCMLESEQDPSTIKTPSPGKLVRYLVEDGSHVTAGTPVAEIEVMKLYIPLLSTESGSISFVKPAGSSIETGDLIASLVLDNPGQKSSVEEYEGGVLRDIADAQSRPLYPNLDEDLLSIMQGYRIADYKAVVNAFFERFNDPGEVVDCFRHHLYPLTGRIPAAFEAELRALLSAELPLEERLARLTAVIEARRDEVPTLWELVQLLCPAGSLLRFKRRVLIRVIEAYWQVERAFHGDVTVESVYANLGTCCGGDDALAIANCFRSHYNVQYKNGVFTYFLDRLLKNPDWGHALVKDGEVENALRQVTVLSGPKYFLVAHASRDLILQSRSISPVVLYQEMETKLLHALATGDEQRLLDDMILGRFASMDVLPKFFHHQREDVRDWALEAYIRRMFQSYEIRSVERLVLGNSLAGIAGAFKWTFLGQPSVKTRNGDDSDYECAVEDVRTGCIVVFDGGDLDALRLETLIDAAFGDDDDDMRRKKVCYVVLSEAMARDVEEDEFIRRLSRDVSSIKRMLAERNVRRITFAVNPPHLIAMSYFTLRASLGYAEDSNIRHVEPALSYLLELKRITDNHDVTLKYADMEGQVHIYLAREKERDCGENGSGNGNGNGNVPRTGTRHLLNPPSHPRTKNRADASLVEKMFVRLLIRPNQMMREHRTMLHFFPAARAILEQMFETLETVMTREPWIPRVKDQFIISNHLFINIIAVFFHSAEEVAQVLEHLMVYYDERFNRLGIRAAEIVMNLVEAEGEIGGGDLRKSRELVSQCQRVRFFFENSLGIVNATEMHAYRESYADGKLRLDCFYGKPKHNGTEAHASYSATSDMELRRNRVLKLGSTYIYDFPRIFKHALAEIWRDEHGSGECGVVSGVAQEDSPPDTGSPPVSVSSSHGLQDGMISFSEIRLDEHAGQDGIVILSSEDMSVSSASTAEMRIGMVAWLVRYASPEYPEGRDFVLVGNDLDHEIGSFGVAEDELFFRVTEFARRRRIPRVYIAANSGAKFGLAADIIDRLRVEWTDDGDHAKGVEFLYLEDGDYAAVETGSVAGERVRLRNGQLVWRLTAVIGRADEGLGVENLQGSGLIAGATTRAYHDTFTLTYVTGRAVGIGAYLVRLGQRTIQRRDAPIILTGCQALNSILGRDVYLSNLQIGGPQIMAANGVSHRIVGSDFEGVREILHWLAFVPVASPLDMAVPRRLRVDPVDRAVGVTAVQLAADPRMLLTGGDGLTGVLDAGSFTEYLEAWARSVIVGRGKLGGLAVGVICTECRATECSVPSDPGRPDGRFEPVRQAGQVWYPDSAWKTAQALRDFRLERLPVLIFANWRGFSGGPGDLYDGILQFGSLIVDELSRATTPVLVYLPAGAELRGGSWVVLDASINRAGRVEMYADPSARGGVMEPDGIVAIKFRERALSQLMCRLEQQERISVAQEETLGCVYRQIAIKYADLHDTAVRMAAKGVIRATLLLADSRRFLHCRLARRLYEEKHCIGSGRGEEDEESVCALEDRRTIEGLFQQKMHSETDATYEEAADALVLSFFRTWEDEIAATLATRRKQRRIQQLETELAVLCNQ